MSEPPIELNLDAIMRFEDWWQALPVEWQEGLCIAVNGGVWMGNLNPVGRKGRASAVIFASPEWADAIERFLKEQAERMS
jgi:hypothetical protein